MNILIIGAAGMVGRKLTERLARDGSLGGTPIDSLILADVVAPIPPENSPVRCESITIDLSAPPTAPMLIGARPDVIFHLAAIVSGEAEADLRKGYRINLDGTRYLFDAIRDAHEADGAAGGDVAGGGYTPRVVFTSSIAVFGAPFPERIHDEFFQTPLTSYGTQKAIGELILADYSRRGLMDGIGLRLPTICIRPGKPNKAASGFFSNILREPINGLEAVLPVDDSVQHWFASPRAAVDFLLHAATMDTARLGDRRNLSLPGLTATVGDEIAALERVVGSDAVKLIRREKDPVIEKIVAGWPRDFDTRRAIELGFRAETDFDQIIRVYLEDEMGKA